MSEGMSKGMPSGGVVSESEGRIADLESQLEKLRREHETTATHIAGGVAHDLNNLLLAILTNAQVLDQRLADSDLRALLQPILTASEQATGLTRRLIAYARRPNSKASVIEARDLLARAATRLRRELAPIFEIREQVNEGIRPLTGDLLLLRDAVIALGQNAAEAMPEGGVIELVAEPLELDAEACIARGVPLEPGNYLAISVTDTGAGMDSATLERACEPFFSTRPSLPGRGLGLALTKRAAAVHGGTLSLHSQLGSGSTICLYLPQAAPERLELARTRSAVGMTRAGSRAPSISSRRQASSVVEFRHRGGTILLAEDDPLVRKIASKVLSQADYQVLETEDGAAAVAAFRAARETVSLVLLDLSMPHLDGSQALGEIRQLAPSIPAIIMSGKSAATVRARLGSEIDVRCLTKPFNPSELLSQVGHALGSS